MRPLTRSKLPDVGTTIFTVMSQLALDCNAINLSQGFPSFDPPAALLALIEQYLRSGANQYAAMAGVPALREAIAAKVASLYGRSADADTEITVCTGAMRTFARIRKRWRWGEWALPTPAAGCG